MNGNISSQRGSFLLVIGIIFAFIVLLTLGVWAYFSFYKLAYSDSTYGFIIKDQRGWYSVPKKEGVYYSLGTSDSPNGKVISYFGISPIIHAVNNAPESLETFKKFCGDTAQETNTTSVDTSSIIVNNLHGFLCISEGKATNVDKIYILKQYFLKNSSAGKYDYVISVSYPKGDIAEEEKVNKIINNFYAN